MAETRHRASGRRRVTIYDIAAEANASAATVSLVLNGSWSRYRIAEGTAQRVLQSADRLGYNVNLAARGLRLSKSGLAGMILPHYRNCFFAELAEAFEIEARRRCLCPIVVSTQRDPAVEVQVTETLLAQRVESLFIAGVANPAPLNALCRAAEVPCVNLDLHAEGAPSVVSDNEDGARRLTETLIERVAARGGLLADIIFLGGIAGEYATDRRVASFLDTLRAAGRAVDQTTALPCGYAPESARDALQCYVSRRGRLPAGILVNSITAFEGLLSYGSAGPMSTFDGVAVACFDWDPFASRLPLDIVMLRQNVEAMVEEAFDALAPDRQLERSALVMVEPALMRGGEE